jgi:TrmH RNA methyltransferase
MTKPGKPKRPAVLKAADASAKQRNRAALPSASRTPEIPDPSADAHEKLAKITGLQAVTALFRADPQRVMRLYYEKRLKNAVGAFCSEMAHMRRPYRMVDAEELSRIAGTVLHGGIVAAAKVRPVPALDLQMVRRWARAGAPLVILDGVSNPHNLGAIARTVAFFGLQHLVVSDHPAQAGLSGAAHRVAEGGLEYLEVHQACHLPQVLKRLQPAFRVVGTALGAGAVPLPELPYDGRPIALVLGNEETGLTPQTLAACEVVVTIPGSGKVQSLNVSATAAILIHTLAGRRGESCAPRKTLSKTRG